MVEDLILSNPLIEIDTEEEYQSSNDVYENVLLYVHEKENLKTHLYNQLQLTTFSNHPIAIFIIESISENGKLEYTNEILAELCDANIKEVERVISIIQKFDPSGICYRDLRESLLIQLRNLNKMHSLEYKILTSYYQFLIHGEKDRIAEHENTSIDEVEHALYEITKLNPFPASNYSQSEQYIIPEILLEVDETTYSLKYIGKLPKISIKKYNNNSFTKEEKNFVKNHSDKARYLLYSINSRIDTLMQICDCIISKQISYFRNGKSLYPLTYKDVAQELQIDPSTVCRAVNQKYLIYKNEIYELKQFFSKEVNDGISKAYVKERIQSIISNEKIALSDELISRELKKEGIQLTGRGVGKYRKELGILSSKNRNKK